MTKAAIPMTGGISWPPVEARASWAPAYSGEYPVLFIRGMVNTPVATTLATALPLIVPNIALEITAALAAPPFWRPTARKARSMKSWPPPEAE